MQIKDITKRRDDEIVIHYTDDDGEYQTLRAYPSDIIAWHRAAQHEMQPTGETCLNCGRPLNGGACAPCFAPSLEDFTSG
jgi:hypothetical protein